MNENYHNSTSLLSRAKLQGERSLSTFRKISPPPISLSYDPFLIKNATKLPTLPLLLMPPPFLSMTSLVGIVRYSSS